jgi:hypothetical protein
MKKFFVFFIVLTCITMMGCAKEKKPEDNYQKAVDVASTVVATGKDAGEKIADKAKELDDQYKITDNIKKKAKEADLEGKAKKAKKKSKKFLEDVGKEAEKKAEEAKKKAAKALD